MSKQKKLLFPNISLSHFELFVDDAARMQEFYTHHLGFVVTDRGKGKDSMVFLSRNPNEHHQLVLNPMSLNSTNGRQVDHISFRVDSLVDLRVFHESLLSNAILTQTVSHGTSWSIYFLDPEGNRLELFTDTPWHVDQPCRFEVDFVMSDEELLSFTERSIKYLPGFTTQDNWRASHSKLFTGGMSQ